MTGDPIKGQIQQNCLQLEALCRSIDAFTEQDQAGSNSYNPPIIDRHESYTEDGTSGLSRFKALCVKELSFLKKVSQSSCSIAVDIDCAKDSLVTFSSMTGRTLQVEIFRPTHRSCCPFGKKSWPLPSPS